MVITQINFLACSRIISFHYNVSKINMKSKDFLTISKLLSIHASTERNNSFESPNKRYLVCTLVRKSERHIRKLPRLYFLQKWILFRRNERGNPWYNTRHGLRTPNEDINQRYLKNWAGVADKICFCRTYKFWIGIEFSAVQWRPFPLWASVVRVLIY